MSVSGNNKKFFVRFRAYIISSVAGAFFAALALFVFSAATWLLQLTSEFSDTFSMLAFGVGCLASGIIIGKIKRQSGLSRGLKAGLVMLLPLIVISFFSGSFTGEFLIGRIVTATLCGMVGGVIGVNRK